MLCANDKYTSVHITHETHPGKEPFMTHSHPVSPSGHMCHNGTFHSKMKNCFKPIYKGLLENKTTIKNYVHGSRVSSNPVTYVVQTS